MSLALQLRDLHDEQRRLRIGVFSMLRLTEEQQAAAAAWSASAASSSSSSSSSSSAAGALAAGLAAGLNAPITVLQKIGSTLTGLAAGSGNASTAAAATAAGTVAHSALVSKLATDAAVAHAAVVMVHFRVRVADVHNFAFDTKVVRAALRSRQPFRLVAVLRLRLSDYKAPPNRCVFSENCMTA